MRLAPNAGSIQRPSQASAEAASQPSAPFRATLSRIQRPFFMQRSKRAKLLIGNPRGALCRPDLPGNFRLTFCENYR